MNVCIEYLSYEINQSTAINQNLIYMSHFIWVLRIKYGEISFLSFRLLCRIAIMISITTIIIQIQEVQTSLFLSTFRPWPHEERETQITKAYDNRSYIDTHGASRGVKDLSSSLPVETRTDLLWSDPKKNNHALQRSNLNYSFFQNPPILRTITSEYDVNHPFNSISCLGIYYDRRWLSYPFCVGVKVYHLIIVPELRDIEWFIALQKSII